MKRKYNTLINRALCASAVVFCIVFCQCIYFNLFYNAKSSFDTARHDHQKLLKNNPDSILATIPSEINSNYDRAIDKASKVMEEYPNNLKWHDDALFLIGKAYYYKGDNEKAIRVFTGLQEDFPASPFIPESFLYLGKAYLQSGNLDKADEIFSLVLEKYPQLNANEEVSLLIVDLSLSRGGKSVALDLLEKATPKVKSRERKIDIIIKTAKIAMDLKQYDKAIDILRKYPREKKFTKKNFIMDFILVDCYIEKGFLQDAMNLTNFMLANRLYGEYVPEILLKKALLFAKMGKFDDALSTYSSITDVYSPASVLNMAPPSPVIFKPKKSSSDSTDSSSKKSSSNITDSSSKKTSTGNTDSASGKSAPPVSSRYGSSSNAPPITSSDISPANQATAGIAWFEKGNIYLDPKGEFLKAKDCFAKAIMILQDTSVKTVAIQRVRSLDSFFLFCGIKDTVDSVKHSVLRNVIDFKIGELFWLEMNLPDSACAHFKRIAQSNDSLRPKALYCVFYILRNSLRDTANADSLYSSLLKEYPSNIYTKRAQIDCGRKISVHTRLDSAWDAYASAESLFFKVDVPETAVAAFKDVYDSFPDCEPGLKALYASAWINDEVLKNNKTAYKLYRMFCDTFPKCEICANIVKPKLKTVSDSLAARKAAKKSGTTALTKDKKVVSRQAQAPLKSISGQSDSVNNRKIAAGDSAVKKQTVTSGNPRLNAGKDTAQTTLKNNAQKDTSIISKAGAITEDTAAIENDNDESAKNIKKSADYKSVKTPVQTPTINVSPKTASAVKDSVKSVDSKEDTVEIIGQLPAKK
jgi:tetratricopeptide (TPR) repeat protein